MIYGRTKFEVTMKFIKDTRAAVIMVIWTIYVLFLYFYFETLAMHMQNANFFMAFLFYLTAQPIYVIFIYSIWQYGKSRGRRVWKRILASVLIVLAGDAVALPRLLVNTPLNGAEISSNIGAIALKGLAFLPLRVAHIMWYVVIPILAVMISVELIGVTNFLREVKK